MALRYNITEFNCDGEIKNFVTPERYDPISYLAKGSQGIVCRGMDNDKNKGVVIKHCREPFSNAENAKRFYREFVLSRIVDHRNVIKLEYAYTPETSLHRFKNMYLIFKEMDFSLFHFRKQQDRRFNKEKGSEFIGILMHQFLSGLQYLHQPNLKLIHRDLSSNNILIKKQFGHNYNYCLKLADLGMARQLPFLDDTDLTKSIGTMPYRAPEILLSSNYNTSVDMWSSGCILYEMITGNILFPTRQQRRLLNQIVRMIPLSDEEFAQLPFSIQENAFTRQINWNYDLLNRELQDYGGAWNQTRISLTQYNELLHRLLTFDPSNRITAEEALNLPVWDYLKGCTFYSPSPLDHALPYVEEYNNIGTTEEWRERLFNRVVPFQTMLHGNDNLN